LFLAEDEGVDVVRGEFDAVSVGDGVCWTSLYAIAAEDAAGIIDVVNFGIAFPRRNSLRFRIFRSLDVDTVRRAGGGAEKATDAFLEAVFVTLQDVDASITGLNAGRDLGKVFSGGFAKHRAQRNAKSFKQRHKCFANFSDDRCHRRLTVAKLNEAGKFLSRVIVAGDIEYSRKRHRERKTLRAGHGHSLKCE
jgi:hypothetical protein